MSADCQHWQDTGHPHAGRCAVAVKLVSAGVCEACLRDGKQGQHLRPAPRGLGDVVASVATPIARALGLDCIDKATRQLRPESPCAKRKEALNRAVPMPCSSCGGPADGLRRLGGG